MYCNRHGLLTYRDRTSSQGGQQRKRLHSLVPSKTVQEVAEYVSRYHYIAQITYAIDRCIKACMHVLSRWIYLCIRFLELSADLEIRVETAFYNRLDALPNGPKIVHDDRVATDEELHKQAVDLVSR